MLTLKVTPDDGEPWNVKAHTRDVLVWEKASKGKSFTDLLVSPNLTDLYKVAHIAAKRQQLFSGTLQEFETQTDIEMIGEDEEPDPT
ncbi:hypothetical protein [Kribbella italica]|uniref:Uncharacterized protein n=1 Tax=Kribbella italica TaxID=1540520 RepID=A0A7W9MVE9_9ACTN|nr:hypothetical protein [Kribbella italica]MBB5837749.1 hypothetical protein [Kribbella italica]